LIGVQACDLEILDCRKRFSRNPLLQFVRSPKDGVRLAICDSYDYDSLNRLQRVHEYTGNTATDWQQEYAYDRYGNRSIEQDVTKTWGTGINKKDFTVNTANNNRLGVPSGQTGTMTYDSAGNLTTDTYSGAGVTRVYDAENRMTSETQANSYLAGSYTYNADGQRGASHGRRSAVGGHHLAGLWPGWRAAG
jgi:hypothetical protein